MPMPVLPDTGRIRPRPLLRLWALALMACATAGAGAREPVVAYKIINARTIPDSLTGEPGNAEAGRRLYFAAQPTGCSGCHGSPGGPGAVPSLGGVDAPRLDGVADRLSEGEIRLWLVAPAVLSPDTAMPPFYAVGQRNDPQDLRFGEPLLTATEIEDLIAYLLKAGR